MAAYRHLTSDPVFEREGRWYLRLAGKSALALRDGNGNPVSGFVAGWRPVHSYTGLDGVHLLEFVKDSERATWLVAADGRRLGDRLSDLQPPQRAQLRAAIIARGLAEPDGMNGDGFACIEPNLLADLLCLAEAPRAPSSRTAAVQQSQQGLAMLGAPHRLHMLLQHPPDHRTPNDRRARLAEGWAEDEPGLSRAVGPVSVVRTIFLPESARHLLALTLIPLAGSQAADIDILVNDRLVGQTRLDPEWQQHGADVAFWLAPELVGGRPLQIAFRHSRGFLLAGLKLSAGSPLPRRETLDPAHLLSRFENIGDNCEFGLVQRHFGCNPVGLLRFAGLRDPHRLIRFLDDDFGQFGEPGSIDVRIVGGEYWIVDHVYGFAAHTFRHPHETGAREVIRENEIKIGYLKRKLREDLEDGEKILVYKRVVTQEPAEMLALHSALNRLGTINKLLWVTQADSPQTPGDVEWVGDRLLKGYIGAISRTDANDFDAAAWLLLCRNALAAFEAAS